MKLKFFVLLGITCGITMSCSPSDVIFSNNKNYSINIANNYSSAVNDTPLTMDDIAAYLDLQKEHYPYSDQFIERYQQTSGGYLDTAKKNGVLVDKTLHSPNQKWHFFISWFKASIDDGSITYNADAKKRVYNSLLCPELLLWIFEACKVDNAKVKQAMNVAEEGKSSGTQTSTIAKNMKTVVTWDDVNKAVYDYLANPGELVNHQVSITGEGVYTVNGLSDQGYKRGEKVSFSISDIEDGKTIDSVTCNGLTITNTSGYNYEFVMPYESVEVNIKLKNLSGVSTVALSSHDHVVVKVDNEIFEGSKQITNGEIFSFTCEPEQDFEIKKVSVNGSEIKPIENVYSFQVLENSEIIVKAINGSITTLLPAKYNIKYDLGTRKTPVLLEDNETIFNTLLLVDDKESAVISISNSTYIYGGGSGGSGDNKWVSNNMLKFGTTSVNGELVFNFDEDVNQIKITGYSYVASGKIRVGDATSSDWGEQTADGKTTLITCADLTEVSKTAVEGGNASTITINFAATKQVKLATTNKKPLFLTAIEFLYEED